MRPLVFAAPAEYRRTVPGLLAGSTAGALAAAAVPALHLALPLATGLAGAALAAGRPRAAVPLAGAGLAAAALPVSLPAHPAFALLAAGALTGLGFFLLRRTAAAALPRTGPLAALASCAAGALALFLGARATFAIEAAGVLELLVPAPLPAALLGLFLGVFVSLGAAAAHVVLDADPLEQRHAELAPQLSAELQGLARRAIEAHRATRGHLAGAGSGDAARVAARLEEGASRALTLVERCQELDEAIALRAAAVPPSRLADLRELAARSEDELATRHYGVALRLQEQERGALERMRRDRTRVLAALHAHLAVLERARAALLASASADAMESAAFADLALDPLGGLADELDESGAALAEAHAHRERV